MKELIIRGTDKYIDYLDKILDNEYKEIKDRKKVKKINENILKGDNIDLIIWKRNQINLEARN